MKDIRQKLKDIFNAQIQLNAEDGGGDGGSSGGTSTGGNGGSTSTNTSSGDSGTTTDSTGTSDDTSSTDDMDKSDDDNHKHPLFRGGFIGAWRDCPPGTTRDKKTNTCKRKKK